MKVEVKTIQAPPVVPPPSEVILTLRLTLEEAIALRKQTGATSGHEAKPTSCSPFFFWAKFNAEGNGFTQEQSILVRQLAGHIYNILSGVI